MSIKYTGSRGSHNFTTGRTFHGTAKEFNSFVKTNKIYVKPGSVSQTKW